MTKRLLIIALCLCAVPAQSQPDSSRLVRMTFEDCLEYAMGNSYARESIKLNEESRELDVEQARLERFPGLSASIGENVSHTTGGNAVWSGSYGLDANMVLWQGGIINKTIEQNELYAEQAVYQTYRYDNELTIQILQYFLSILGSEELLKYQQVVLNTSIEQLKQGEAQYAAGMILESDYLLLQAQVANDRNSMIETHNTLNNALLSLKGLMSMDLNVPLSIVYPDTTMIDQLAVLPDREYVTERALLTMPDIDIVRYSVEIAQKNLEIARASFFPTVSLGGSIGSGHSPNFQNYGSQLNDRFNQQAGVSMSIPIFNRGRTRNNVAQSRISLMQAELDRLQTELDIVQGVLQEYNDVRTAHSRYEAAIIRENAYRKSFEAYNMQFNVGSITAVELLQQQNNYISALNEFLQSKYSFILRRKILDVYMGFRIEI